MIATERMRKAPVRITTVLRVAALFVIGLCAAATSAAQQPPEKAQAGLPQADKEPKSAAAPLFPRHHRGLYKNAEGVEVIDATPQSPPLDTDDPAVPDAGVFEVNFTTHADYAKAAQRIDLLSVDANYGLLPVIAGHKLLTQIKLEFPMAAARQAGEDFNVGVGAAAFGVKLNFYNDEHRGISVAVYPQLEFAAPGSRAVEKGLAEKGQTVILPLLIARQFHEFTLVLNGTLDKPVHDAERQAACELGIGFGLALTRKVAAMIELRTASSLDFNSDRLVYMNAGLIHGIRNIILYVNLGHSVFADDNLGHTYAGFGMKALLDTKKKP
jgi:hypothetical protein